ncbi:MAG: DUF2336 domain-containing protein [Alphaproteobacteria bacterium]|nr:DUF2336 domain-containing protein [Alphaproteobacteria bacterium]
MTDAVIQQKIEALLGLARSEADEAKDRIADDLSEIIYVDGAPFSPRELDIATDILRKLVHEAETAVRQRMADRLARDGRAPRDLVLALARDDIMVARPVLAMSAALRDRDLIEIVRHKTKQHQLAVAARQDLSKGVSAVVAETGDTDVVSELLKNPSARIAEATYAYIAERSQKETALQVPLLKREDLPGDVAARMYGWVASELRTVIEQKYKMPAHLLEEPLLESLGDIAAGHGPEVPWDEAERGLAEAIKAERLNDPMVLVRLIKTGHISLFEALFARYLNVGIRLARRILYQPDGRALAVACRAAGIERPVVAALLEAVPIRSEDGSGRGGQAEREAAIDLFRRITHQESLDVLRRWRLRGANLLAG